MDRSLEDMTYQDLEDLKARLNDYCLLYTSPSPRD